LDPLFEFFCAASATLLLSALAGVLGSLLIGGWPAFSKFGLKFFTSTDWNPVTDIYGGAGPIVGTILTAIVALVLALPVAFLVAVFLTEFCPRPLRRPIGIAVELLAGVPSIVYGMWGLFVFAPLFAPYVEIPLMSAAPPGSFLETLFSGVPNGSGLITASIILAIMILPFIAATLRELFLTVPAKVRESAYGVGCTSLEVVWSVTLPYVRRSAIGAVMLGLGRALGETMAVTFVIGNSHDFPKGLFDGGSTIASTIANEFAEATSDMHTSALLALGFVLFLITFAVLALARTMLGAQKNV
jgi:phosphate transport system permease protein